MGIGWFVTMNILQPRLMSGAVGIHPIVVLASVVIGAKIAGIAGAIFGIPIAAVLSAFFFHWFGAVAESGTVADRATKRVAAREGRRGPAAARAACRASTTTWTRWSRPGRAGAPGGAVADDRGGRRPTARRGRRRGAGR